MSSNTLRTRIRSKIDYLANWNNNTTFIPLLGEICIAIIPRNVNATDANGIATGVDTSIIGEKGVENAPRTGVGLTPYAIGMKVGDGVNNFATLPWIQAVAGDIYSWAKNDTPPSASQIGATYGTNSNIDTVQEAIDEIRDSLGNIVAGNVDPSTLSSALEALQAQLSGGGTQTLFTSNSYLEPEQEGQDPVRQYPTKIIRSIIKDGLAITVQGDNLVEDDLPNIHINKISDFSTTGNYDSSTNPLATQGYVDSAISPLISQISGGISFLGVVYESDLLANNSQRIEDGSIVAPIFRVAGSDPVQYRTTPTTSLTAGNVILYRKAIITIDENTNTEVITDAEIGKEFIWTGGAWEEFGDEGSYVLKGSITRTDFTSDLLAELEGKLNITTAAANYVAKEQDKSLMSTAEHNKLAGIAAGAEVNVIDGININGTAQTPVNKKVNIEIPTISINDTVQTPTNHNINIEIPIIKNGVNNATIANDHSITFAPIAFSGTMDDIDALNSSVVCFDCGNATDKLYQLTN